MGTNPPWQAPQCACSLCQVEDYSGIPDSYYLISIARDPSFDVHLLENDCSRRDCATSLATYIYSEAPYCPRSISRPILDLARKCQIHPSLLSRI